MGKATLLTIPRYPLLCGVVHLRYGTVLAMYVLTPENRSKIVFILALVVAKLSFSAVLVLVLLEAYVRWTINKQFAFLSGFELEALTVSTFVLIISLSYLYRPSK